MKTKNEKREEAKVRDEISSKRSAKEQLALLDTRFGKLPTKDEIGLMTSISSKNEFIDLLVDKLHGDGILWDIKIKDYTEEVKKWEKHVRTGTRENKKQD